MLALSLLAFLQTVSLGSRTEAGSICLEHDQRRSLSNTFFRTADARAHSVSRVALPLREHRVSYSCAGLYNLRDCCRERSLRNTAPSTQHETGFLLPLLKQNQGYGQFINKNHFAYLMEMAFGLGLGIILGGGVERERLMIYVAILLPIWTGLVLANSRGGILAMLAQVVVAVLLLISFRGLARITSFQKSPNQLRCEPLLLVVLVVGILVRNVLGRR